MITQPAVGDLATSAWADLISAQLNGVGIVDSGTWAVPLVAQIQVSLPVTFNAAFSGAPIVIATPMMTNSGGQDYLCGISPATVTASGCTVVVRTADGTARTATATIQWFAIGS